MQISVQIVVQTEIDKQASVTEIAHFDREASMPARSACILTKRRRCLADCSVR